MVNSKKIAIIGAGPVGLAMAKMLEDSHYVTLYDKKSLPIDKVCGQGLLNPGLRILQSLGIEPPGYNFKAVRFLPFHFYLPIKGRGVKRLALSKALIDSLQKTNIQTKEIQSVSASGHVHTAEGKSLFDHIIFCDGLQSKLSDALNPRVSFIKESRLGARVHYQVKPWAREVQVFTAKGIEAYVTPTAENEIEVAYLMFAPLEKKLKPIEAQKLLSFFPALQEKIQGSQELVDFKVYAGFPHIRENFHLAKKHFWIGDSYSFYDGATGEGITMGLKSARQIANYLLGKQSFFKTLLMIKFMYAIHLFKVKALVGIYRFFKA